MTKDERRGGAHRPQMPRKGKSILLDAKEFASEFGWSDEAVAAIHAARDAGWTLQEIGDVLGVTREYVRQLYGTDVDSIAEISGFPPKPRRPRGPDVVVPKGKLLRQLVSDEEIAELVELAQLSKWRRRGGSGEYAAAAEEFWSRINHLSNLGVPRAWLSKRLGLSSSTVRMGLGRYGYLPLPPSAPQRRTGTTGDAS